MVQQIEDDSLLSTWRALDNAETANGWRTIVVATSGNCRLLAGRRFPGNEEAILVGFKNAAVPHDKNLPQGQGFQVNRLERGLIGDNNVWVALSRLAVGSLDMFTLMANDISRFLKDRSSDSEDSIFRAFISRIHAWQNFMDRGNLGILSNEAEVGLLGELIILKSMINEGIPAIDAVNSWNGPVGGLQDFAIGTGGIEVKSTISPSSFPAKISSLEQLDVSLVQPLYLVGVRLGISSNGQTLTEFSKSLASYFALETLAKSMYENKLIQAGLIEAHADKYFRRFTHLDTLVFHVSDHFPKLTKATVPLQITRANYEIDLAMIEAPHLNLLDSLNILRGI